MGNVPEKCPCCGNRLFVSELTCEKCNLVMKNKFSLGAVGLLSKKHQEFIGTFLRCRGNIKEVEKELGVSYPTVKKQLEEVVSALKAADAKEAVRRDKILSDIEKGKISAKEGANLLRQRGI